MKGVLWVHSLLEDNFFTANVLLDYFFCFHASQIISVDVNLTEETV